MFPAITIDWTFFSNIVSEILTPRTPFGAVWAVIKLGGWVPLVYLFIYAVKEFYLINISEVRMTQLFL